MGRIRDTIFWMKWPPPRWVWVAAAIVIGGAAAIIMLTAP